MKIALIFLSVMVAITTQQFQQQQERLWWSPYYYPAQPSINNNQRAYQVLQDDIQPEYRHFRPTRPNIYTQNEEFNPVLVAAPFQDYVEEDEYPDVQSRVKVNHQRRPLFSKPAQDPRFLFNNMRLFRVTTATLTVTSSLTLTTVQSCIAAVKFVDDAAKKTACRRKRELLDSNPEDNQFAIVPTETQRVIPTDLPTLDLIGENQVSADHDIASSKGASPGDFSSGTVSRMRSLSESRLLNLVSVVSVTTFAFQTATVTKTIVIADDAKVSCLPSGWAVC